MGLGFLGYDGHERRRCQYTLCPEGRMWGICPQPAHWQRQAPKYGSVSSTRKEMTFAHLLQTAGYNLGHAMTHIDAAMKPKSPSDQKFNLEHAKHHMDEVQDHLSRLIEHIRKHYPAEAKELDNVLKAEAIGEGAPGQI